MLASWKTLSRASRALARKNLEEAANAGLLGAQYDLALLLPHGDSRVFKKDVSGGIAWLERAARVRPPEDDEFLIGYMLRANFPDGHQYPIDYARGLVACARAMTRLASHYHMTSDEPRRDLAITWYEKSIATYELALKHLGPQDTCKPDVEKDLKRDVEALSVVYDIRARMKIPGIDVEPSKVLACFAKGARLGIDLCQYMLAKSYFSGTGVPRDINKAVRWFTRADESGFPYAALFLAMIHYGVKELRDDAVAIEWAMKAQALNSDYPQLHTSVCLILARAHLYGLGTVPRDTEKGIQLLDRKPFNKFTRCEVGVCLSAGIGLPRDKHMALAMFQELAEREDAPCFAEYMYLRLMMLNFAAQSHCLKILREMQNCTPIEQLNMDVREIHRCEECRRDDARFRCRGCFVARYCSRECQRRGWRDGMHKHECPMNFPCQRCARKTGKVMISPECECAARAAERKSAMRQASEVHRRETPPPTDEDDDDKAIPRFKPGEDRG